MSHIKHVRLIRVKDTNVALIIVLTTTSVTVIETTIVAVATIFVVNGQKLFLLLVWSAESLPIFLYKIIENIL